jgi:uncharacterized protein involved in outer membrane biogenesis
MRRRRWLVVLFAVPAVLVLGTFVGARLVLGSDLVRQALEQQLSAAFNQPVRIESVTAAIFPRVSAKLHDLTIGDPPAVRIRELRIATGLRPLLSRTIHDAEVVVADGRVMLPLPFDLPSSSELPPQGGSHASGNDQSGNLALTVASVRTIGVRGLAFVAGQHTFTVDASSSLDGDRLEIQHLSARAQTTRIEASGALESLAQLRGQFEARADPLDLDELMAFGSALTAPAPSKPGAGNSAAAMRLRIALTAPTGQFAANGFSDLSTTIDVAPGRLALAPLSVRSFGGKFDGRLDADTMHAVPDLRLNGRLEGLDVVEVMKAGGSPGGITGRLGGTVALTGTGTESDRLIRTARGTISAAITDGTMPHLDMVRTIVLAFGKPSGAPPEGSGSAFSRMAGTFALVNGSMSSTNLTMAARDFDMAGSGTLQIATGAASSRVDVILSKELTSQAGTDLRRYAQEDGRVIVPATIGGTLQRPAVSIDIAAATRRALGNELQRRVKSFMDDLFKKKK